VWVASRYLMRCRGNEPQESKSRKGRFRSGHTLEQNQVHGRIRASSQDRSPTVRPRKGLGGSPARAKAMEASPTRQGDTGRSAILRRTGELHERRGRRGDAADPSRTDLKSSGGEHRPSLS
jgi:hypothetical protein